MTHVLLLVLSICSPFDKNDAGDVDGRLADGGIPPDQVACCGGKAGCPPRTCSSCGQANRQVGAPVDTLNGFALVDRTDVNASQPWGPSVAFTRHYSTGWAQGRAAPVK